jgi:hypothetical protein
MFPAVGDGAIEALEEVKPRLGAWNKIPDEIGRAIVRQRAAKADSNAGARHHAVLTQCALYRRLVGRQVHEDLHLAESTY